MAQLKHRTQIRKELWYIADLSAFPLVRLLRNHFRSEEDARLTIKTKLWNKTKEYDVIEGAYAIQMGFNFWGRNYKVLKKNRIGRVLKYAYPILKGRPCNWTELTYSQQFKKSYRTVKRYRERRAILLAQRIEELKNQKI